MVVETQSNLVNQFFHAAQWYFVNQGVVETQTKNVNQYVHVAQWYFVKH